MVYSIAKPEELEEVAEFAEEHYFSSSPLCEIFSLEDVADEERLAYRRDCFQRCFQHPTSIVVREKSTGRLVAFLASIVRKRSEASAEILVDPNDRSPGWLVRAMTAELYEVEDLYGLLYQTDWILHFWRGGVRKDYQGQKLIGMSSTKCSALFAKIAHANQIGAMMAEGFSNYAGPEKFMENRLYYSLGDFPITGWKASFCWYRSRCSSNCQTSGLPSSTANSYPPTVGCRQHDKFSEE